MMIPKTKIEYLKNDDGSPGYIWNFLTGCENWGDPQICPMGEKCWAKRMAHRFNKSFTPAFHFDRFVEDFPESACRVGVCLTGDLFSFQKEEFWDEFLPLIVHKINCWPQHQFFFLTKRPENIPLIEWPTNVWMGVSAWDQESWDRNVGLLERVNAHRWVSIEPMYGPIVARAIVYIDWMVIGAQTAPYRSPNLQWVRDLEESVCVPVWEKNNLTPYDKALRLGRRRLK